MCVLKDFGPNKFQNLILSEILENEDICGEDMQSQCIMLVLAEKKKKKKNPELASAVVASNFGAR